MSQYSEVQVEPSLTKMHSSSMRTVRCSSHLGRSTWQGASAWQGWCTPLPPVDRENITIPQLLLRTVKWPAAHDLGGQGSEVPCLGGGFGTGGSLYDEVKCIMGNGHMGRPP